MNKRSLDLDGMENPYLFGEKLEEKLIKITSAKQKSKSIITVLQQRKPTFSLRPNYNQPFLSDPWPGNLQGGSTRRRGQGCFFSRAATARGKNIPSSVSSTESMNSQSRNVLIHKSCNQRFISSKGVPKVSTGGSSQYFSGNWKKITSDPFIFNIVKGYQIPFQMSSLPLISMTPLEKVSVDQEIEQMLKKGAIKVVQQDLSLFLSSIFLVPKKDSGHCPVINLKNLNYYIPYSHFKMEGLFLLKKHGRKRATYAK